MKQTVEVKKNAKEGVEVTHLNYYSPDTATELATLLPHLSEKLPAVPIKKEKLFQNVHSLNIVQLIARDWPTGKIVGAATITQLGGLLPENKAWLEDFIVLPEARGKGVADALADAWEDWCRERSIKMLMFTSGWQRTAAHKFYLKRGAKVLNSDDDVTAFWNYPIPAKKQGA